MNLLKIILACSVWFVNTILIILAINGIGNIQTHFPHSYTDLQWQIWYKFFDVLIYVYWLGLPLYISGIIPIIKDKIKPSEQQQRQMVE